MFTKLIRDRNIKTSVIKYIDKVFFLLLCITPLIVSEKHLFGIEIFKIEWLWLIAPIYASIKILTGQIYSKNIVIFGLIWLSYLFIRTILGEVDISFFGGYFRKQGFWFYLNLFLIWFSVSNATFSQKWASKVILFTSVIALIFGLFFYWDNRAIGTIGEPNAFGYLAGSTLIIAFSNNNYIFSICALIMLMLSGSRAAWFGAFFAFAKNKLIFFLPLVVITILFVIPRSFGERFWLWNQSYKIWLEAKYFGVGLDRFQGLVNQNYDHPHNIFLYWLISTGIVGFGLFFAWVITIYLTSKQGMFKKLIVFYFIYSFFQPSSAVVLLYFFMFLGLCSKEDKIIKERPGFNLFRLILFVLLVLLNFYVVFGVFRAYLVK